MVLLNSCAATRCGVVQLQNSAESGVVVSNNPCTEPAMAAQSAVYLQAGSSVRLAAAPDTVAPRLICRNQSSYPLKISVASSVFPWIRPEQDLIRCGTWRNGRLDCTESWSDKVALVCAVVEQHGSMIFAEAPFKMRGADDTETDIEEEKVEYELKKNITPKIAQCRKEFPSDQSVILEWTIQTSGAVSAAANPDESKDDKFVDCAVNVIENFIFPPLRNVITVKREFGA